MSQLYPTVNPILYMYFASSTLTATGIRSRNLNEIAVAEYARHDVPPLLGVAQWGTRYCDYSDNRIGRPSSEMSKLNRPCIVLFSSC